MARPYRIQFEGAVAHVTVRGIPRKKMFKDDQDFNRIIQMMADSADKHEVIIHAFCVAENQIDALIETPRGNASSFLQGFQTGYAQYFRQRYRKKGSLVRDRFRSKIVEPAYMLPMSRLIHLLAIQGVKGSDADRKKALRAYKWSSYRSYAGLGTAYGWLETAKVLKSLPGAAAAKAKLYRDYVEEGLGKADTELAAAMRKSQLAIGSPEYVDKIRKDHARFVSGQKPAHLKVYGKRQGGVAKAKVIDAVCAGLDVERELLFKQKKNVLYRPTAAFMLYRHSKMSQDQIAEYLKLSSGAAVSLQIRRVRDARDNNGAYRKRLEKIDKVIKGG